MSSVIIKNMLSKSHLFWFERRLSAHAATALPINFVITIVVTIIITIIIIIITITIIIIIVTIIIIIIIIILYKPRTQRVALVGPALRPKT